MSEKYFTNKSQSATNGIVISAKLFFSFFFKNQYNCIQLPSLFAEFCFLVAY